MAWTSYYSYPNRNNPWKKFWRILFVVIILGLIYHFVSFNDLKEGYKYIINKETKDSTNIHDTIYINTLKTDTITLTNQIHYKDSIKLDYKNGHHYITIYINGIPVKGMVDTGATSGFNGSTVDYLFLKKYGYITKPVTEGMAEVADGTKVKTYESTIDSIKIGNKIIYNVSASFFENECETLIGQGVISQLGKLTFDYQNHMLYIN